MRRLYPSTSAAVLLLAAAPIALIAPTAEGGEAGALQVLAEGLPEVAIVKLREALGESSGENALGAEAKVRLQLQLVEALLEAGRAQEALSELETLDPAVLEHQPLLKGRIYAALQRWAEALPLFEAATAQPGVDEALGLRSFLALALSTCHRELAGPNAGAEAIQAAIAPLEALEHPSVEAELQLAELYLEAGTLDKSGALLGRIAPGTPRENKWKQYLDARQLLAAGHPAYALGRFETLEREPSELSHDLLLGVVFGIADSRALVNSLSSADGVLEKYLSKYPASSKLPLVFRKLDEIYAQEENFSDTALKKWAESSPPLRAGYALFYQAKAAWRERRFEHALHLLERYAERFPSHPMLCDALLMRGELLLGESRYPEAQGALEAAMREAKSDLKRAEIEMVSGAVSFREGEFVLAATLFRAAAERAPALWQRAVFNSALSWLHQGNTERFQHDFAELSERHPESPYRQELMLEEGLLQARQGAVELERARNAERVEKAEESLKRFVAEAPGHARALEAQLALAELRYQGHDLKGAGRYLKVIHETTASPEMEAQAAYLAIFVADANAAETPQKPEKQEEVIKLCQLFLADYPTAKQAPEVRMKLGQIAFHKADFVSAQAEFEQLAQLHPSSPLAEAALFLAGQSAIKSMSPGGSDRAIGLFEEVVKINGPLRFNARLEQAQAWAQLGQQPEAILVYDAVLRDDPPAEIRFAALAAKADNLTELGETKPGAREEALAIYSELAKEPEARATWQSQALYNKARSLASLQRKDEALAAYYDVLEAGVDKPTEYFWFYKAGFDAGALCEERGQWKSAIAIYHKMASLEGPQSEEAKARISQLRLEHFIWE